VCDLDGVVRHFDPVRQAAIEARFGLPAGTISTLALDPRLLQPAITGAVSDETWRASVADALRLRWPSVDAVAAVAEWSASPGTPDERVVTLVRRARERVPVLALTNATTRLRSDLARAGLAGVFDRVVSSAEVGHAKPSAPAFRAAQEAAAQLLGRTVLVPEQILYVDDSPGHVAGAAALGWTAITFEGPQQLAATLRASGLL